MIGQRAIGIVGQYTGDRGDYYVLFSRGGYTRTLGDVGRASRLRLQNAIANRPGKVEARWDGWCWQREDGGYVESNPGPSSQALR